MDEIKFLLKRRVDKIYPSEKELENVLRSGKKLRIYQGFDPSSPILHIGHLAGLKKLADFQKAGHEVIFLIGDFTGMIGDPTGKKDSRQALTHEEVLKNAKEYQKQAEKILKFEGENAAKIMFNYEWNSKLSFLDFLKIAKLITAQNIWERDMFQERVKKGEEVWTHELLYPFIQGYDSVAMDVDMEIGGSDQMFNMMIGRELLRKMKNKNKFVLTTPLLVDKSGKKIGKTEGNAIAISDHPNKLFANMMTLPDEVIIPAFELITDESQEKIDEYKTRIGKGENPMIFKKLLAHQIVKELNTENDAKKAQEEWEKIVQQGILPADLKTYDFKHGLPLIDLVIKIRNCSTSEAKRLITEQNAVEVDNFIITDKNYIVPEGDHIIKIGKKLIVTLRVKNL